MSSQTLQIVGAIISGTIPIIAAMWAYFNRSGLVLWMVDKTTLVARIRDLLEKNEALRLENASCARIAQSWDSAYRAAQWSREEAQELSRRFDRMSHRLDAALDYVKAVVSYNALLQTALTAAQIPLPGPPPVIPDALREEFE
jgi:hypothetical protein